MYKQRGKSMAVSGSRPESLISSHLNSGITPPDPIYSSDSAQHGTLPQNQSLYPQYPLPCEPYDISYNAFESQANNSFNGNGMGGQYNPNIGNININLAFQKDFVMFPDQQPMSQASPQMPQQDMFFNQYTTPNSSSQGSKSTAHSYSPDLPSLPRAVAESTGSKSCFPVLSSRYRYVPSHYSKAVANEPMPSRKREQPSPQASTLQWIAEDPTSKQRHHEKRVRTQADVENRKEDIQKLKEFGGACLWCHRSKKKCDPAQICQPCQANKRKCVRSSSQLCLIGHFKPPTHDNALMSLGPPSQEALNTMYLMAAQAFLDRPLAKAHLNIQHRDRLPGLEVTKDDMDPYKSETKRLINDFVLRATTCIRSVELEKLTATYATHPLILPAIKLTKLFMTIRNLATTQIHLCTSDTSLARSTLLLVLIVSVHNLAEDSESFTLDLCEALRRRNLERTNSTSKHRLPDSFSSSPVSLATELYYQIVEGLLQLTESPVIALIFKNVQTHLQEVRAILKSILASINAIHPKRAKTAVKRAPSGQVTAIPSTRDFELEFRVEWVDVNSHPRSTTANGQGNFPELTCHHVEALLKSGIDNLDLYKKCPDADQTSPVLAEVPAQSISTETEANNDSHTEMFDTPSAQSGIFDEIFNSTPWDWSVAAEYDFDFGFRENQ
ncbi:hypothetical protein N7486_009894 [Penicillium sp. IBT 16267x]|nr:hypothetical protein N7486_009894 [Penicillium sp. IBT 16267x]